MNSAIHVDFEEKALLFSEETPPVNACKREGATLL